MTLEAWALFCATETVLCLNPGPSALLVVSLAMTRGRRAGVVATAGVLTANLFYFALSAAGLGAARSLSAEVFEAIRWAGAAYLFWLGGRMSWRSFRRTSASPRAAPDEAPATDALPARRAFARGLVAQGANPNLLVYFTAILPQFVDPGAALAPQVTVLALSSVAIELVVLSVYAALASGAGRRAGPRLRVSLERAGGGLLVAAGAGLARARQP
jgi:threonine/homoserine/homoserine lactone efflux protein